MRPLMRGRSDFDGVVKDMTENVVVTDLSYAVR